MTAQSPKAVYEALRAQGASQIQALGIMANMMNESGFDPEAKGPGDAVGLVQWQISDYPHAGTLVTGNSAADMKAQIRYLAQTGGFNAAEGTNAGQAAGNFAANYERCASCQPGGQQYESRVSNTLKLAGWAKSGNWPRTAGGSREPGAIGTQGSAPSSTPDCAWQLGLNLPVIGGNICIITKSQLRGIAGVGLLAAGGMVALAGLAVLMAAAGMKALPPLGKAAEGVGGALLLVPGAEAAGAAITAGGRAARSPAAAGRARQSRLSREEDAHRRAVGEPRENRNMEARGGTVRQNPAQRRERRARERRSAAADTPPF